MPNAVSDRLSTSLQVTDSMESIEKDYVLVNAHFASTVTFSCSLETSLLNNSASRVFSCPPKKYDQDVAAAMQARELAVTSFGSAKSLGSHESDPLAASNASTVLREVQGLSILHPSTRLQLLHRYISILSELVQVKFNAGLFLESFSVELVVMAIWKEALRVCSSWLASTMEDVLSRSCSANESTPVQKEELSKSKIQRRFMAKGKDVRVTVKCITQY
uniref:ATG1a/b/c MIT domain-containing protein n=1 Tax=Davidia involucrata TaxID=16924 RepID=A0A5B6YYX1_DAVIN